MELDKLTAALARTVPGVRIREELMCRCTTFRIGGPAAIAEVGTAEELRAALAAAEGGAFLLGRGSNLLAGDGRIERLLLRPAGELEQLRLLPGGRIYAGCAAPLSRAAALARDAGLTGLEFAHGIPGSVGGAVVMNAGAYGGEMRDVAESVDYLDEALRLCTAKADRLGFAYRRSRFTEGGTVLGATLRLAPGDPAQIGARMEELAARRRASQPLELPSAGSTFKRPKEGYAAAMIDEAGLKGRQVGGAQVSEKHAGFIVNRGGATCRDVLALVDIVKEAVLRRCGAELELEVRLLH